MGSRWIWIWIWISLIAVRCHNCYHNSQLDCHIILGDEYYTKMSASDEKCRVTNVGQN